MQKLFFDTRILDSECRKKYQLTEELMMENAAGGMESVLREKFSFHQGSKIKVLLLCGSGNNGADGYAFARRIAGDCEVTCLSVLKAKSPLCLLQKERALCAGLHVIDYEPSLKEDFFNSFTCIADCIFGSGFHGSLPQEAAFCISFSNKSSAFKIACDLPSGLDSFGNYEGEVFSADVTVTMGADKIALYSDCAKDFSGEVKVFPLGIPRSLFEACGKEDAYLLEESDCYLPVREKNNVHKGSFGHAAVFSGEKKGASVIAGCAALRFGAGLVTLVRNEKPETKINVSSDGLLLQSESPLSFELMESASLPEKTSAVALGMGFGHDENLCDKAIDLLISSPNLPCILDADILYCKKLPLLLESRSKCFLEKGKMNVVLTPHPKEFAALLAISSLGEYSLSDVIKKRLELSKKFTERFPGLVLLVKGAVPLISVKNQKEETVHYFNPHGSPSLSKAGSGDVLAGMICALLAQGYDALSAATTSSLAHALSSRKAKDNYSLTPFGLMELIK